MKLVTRSLVVVLVLLLGMTLAARHIPWSQAGAAPATTATTDIAAPVIRGHVDGQVRPGPNEIVTTCHQRGHRLVCKTFLMKTEGLTFTGPPPPGLRKKER